MKIPHLPVVVVLVLPAVLVFGCSVSQAESPPRTVASALVAQAPAPAPAAAPATPQNPMTAESLALPTFGALVESVKASVVNVEVQARAPGMGGRGQQSDLFDHFFGGGRRGPQSAPREQLRQGAGSGFIIDPKGLVLTNNHVIEGAVNIKVKLEDGREFGADVVGRDPLTDLAVLRLKGGQKMENLPVAKLGDSDAIRVGDWVVAIGNPFGLASSVSAGILSAKARQINHSQYDDFLQTDAAINPGNSGGPLFNMKGEVIGINTAIIGGGTGIGFAVPVNIAKTLLPQMQAEGQVTRGYLGVSIDDLNAELAKALNVPVAKGAIVAQVETGTPAQKAGLLADDVITRIDGKPVETSNALTKLVALKRPGTTSTLEVYRQGKKRDVKITLEKRPAELDGLRSGRQPQDEAPREEQQLKVGIEFQDVDPRMAQHLGVPTQGSLITDVMPGSPAERAELAPGMVVVEAGGRPVRNSQELAKAIRGAKSGTVLLLRVQIQGRRTLRALQVP